LTVLLIAQAAFIQYGLHLAQYLEHSSPAWLIVRDAFANRWVSGRHMNRPAATISSGYRSICALRFAACMARDSARRRS
jgi:hypothetical protein